MFNKQDRKRNEFMLTGGFAKKGYDWWWHSFTARHSVTGEEKAFFIEFFICNPARGKDEPILGQLPENREKHIRPSYLMVKAGCWGEDHCQLHRFFGLRKVKIRSEAPFYVSAEDCYASDTLLKGCVKVTEEEAKEHPEYMSDAGEMEWELKPDKQIAFNVGYGASSFFRSIKAFEMYWHAEGMKTAYEGVVVIDGERYVVDPASCYGYADKNWGADFTSPWVWLASSNLTSNLTGKRLGNSAFEIGGGRPKVFSIALERKLLGQLVYEGKPYEFNFSKPWTGSATRFSACETERDVVWHVEQETLFSALVTDIHCPKSDMLFVNYEAPDGAKRHNRLWNGGTGTGRLLLFDKLGPSRTLVDDIAVANVGCEYGEYDT